MGKSIGQFGESVWRPVGIQGTSALKEDAQDGVRILERRDPLGVLEPEEEERVGQAVEGDGQVVGVGDPLEPPALHAALEDPGEAPEEAFVHLADLGVESHEHVLARSLGLREVETDRGHVVAEDLSLDPHEAADLLDLVVGLLDGLRDRGEEPGGLLEEQDPVEVLLVLEELVERPDGELGLLRDLAHGDVAVALPREKIASGGQDVLPLRQLLSFPPWELLVAGLLVVHGWALCERCFRLVNSNSRYTIVRHPVKRFTESGRRPRT